MSLNQNLDDAKKKLEELRKEYEKLTALKAPEFNIGNPENIDKINAAIETMNSSIEKAKKKAKELEDGWGGIAGAIQGALSEINKSETATNRTIKAMQGVRSIADELKQDQQGLRDLSLKELKAKQDKLKILTQEAKEQANIVSEQYNQISLDKNGNRLAEAALEARLKKLGISQKEFSLMGSIAKAAEEELTILDEANSVLEERIQNENQILKKTGLTSVALKSLSGFLSNMGMGSLVDTLGLDDATKKMKELAKDGASSFAVLKGGLSSIGGSIASSLSNPLTAAVGIFGFLYKKAMDADKYIGDMSKNLNIGYDAARGLASEFSGYAAASMDVGITQKGMAEALTQVNNELGTSARLSNEQLGTMEKLNRYSNLSYQDQAQMLRTSMALGETYEGYVESMMGTIKAQKFENNLALNAKKIMLDINKATDRTKISIEGGSAGIAKAAVEARKLGVSLDDVTKIADNLLNFEQSIEDELSAELLTGKQLNLEEARRLALNNDFEGVAREINNQIGSAAEFSEMNRIQQEAMAKAVGMTADQLASALVEQEALKAVGHDLNEEEKEAYEAAKAKYGAEEAAKMLKEGQLEQLVEEKSLADERQAQMDKFNSALEGLAIAFIPFFEMLFEVANVVIPMISIALEPVRLAFEVINGLFSDGKNNLTGMQEVVGSIAIGLMGIVSIYKIWNAAMMLQKGLRKAALLDQMREQGISKTTAIINIVKGAWSSVGIIPFVGAGLAIAAIAGGIAALMSQSKGDDVFSPAPGGSGYGKRTLLGPEGAIQLNNKDTIIAGTNLFGNDIKSEPGKPTQMSNAGNITIKSDKDKGSSNDMSAMVSAITALASRPVNVGVDGKNIIEATTGANPNTQGTEVAKNSYRIQ